METPKSPSPEMDKVALVSELSNGYNIFVSNHLYFSTEFILYVAQSANVSICPQETSNINIEKALIDEYIKARNFYEAEKVFASNKTLQETYPFLFYYCVFLRLEKKYTMSTFEEIHSPIYQEKLIILSKDIKDYTGVQNSLCLYLKGLIQLKIIDPESRKKARSFLLESLTGLPFNWEAIQLASKTLDTVEEISESPLPSLNHWGTLFLTAEVSLNGPIFTKQNNFLEDLLQSLEQLFPDCLAVQPLKGKLAYRSGNYDKAAALFPADSPVWADWRSNALFMAGDDCELGAFCLTLCDIAPRHAKTYFAAGNMFSLKGFSLKAEQLFSKAVALEPLWEEAHILLGHSYLAQNKHKKAEKSYEVAAFLAPQDFRPVIALAGLKDIAGENTMALHCYWKALELSPFDERIWLPISDSLFKMGRITDSLNALEKAKRTMENKELKVGADMLLKFADIYALRKEMDKELEYREKIMEEMNTVILLGHASGEYIDSAIKLARIYISLEKTKEAKQTCEVLKDIGGRFRNEIISLENELQISGKTIEDDDETIEMGDISGI